MNFVPKILAMALATQVSCQLFKLVFYSIKDRHFRIKYLVNPGGMPSSHSAFVTSLMTGVGVFEGLLSTTFAIAFVFGAIVVYDALKLRGAVQEHAKLLNKIQENLPETVLPPSQKVRLREMLGHNIVEIGVGVAIAVTTTLPLALLLRSW